jgi:hypothetical protein
MLTFISDVRPRERTTTDSQFLFDQVGVNLDLVVLHVDALHNAGNTSEYERSVPASCERKIRRAEGRERQGRGGWEAYLDQSQPFRTRLDVAFELFDRLSQD